MVLSTITGGRWPSWVSNSETWRAAAMSTSALVGFAGVSINIAPTRPFLRASSAARAHVVNAELGFKRDLRDAELGQD